MSSCPLGLKFWMFLFHQMYLTRDFHLWPYLCCGVYLADFSGTYFAWHTSTVFLFSHIILCNLLTIILAPNYQATVETLEDIITMNKTVQHAHFTSLPQVFEAYGRAGDDVMMTIFKHHMAKPSGWDEYHNWTRAHVFGDRTHVVLNHMIGLKSWGIGEELGIKYYASKEKLGYKWPLRDTL